MVADVSDRDSVAAAFASIDAEEGRIDVLVNNAGIQRAGLIGQLSVRGLGGRDRHPSDRDVPLLLRRPCRG